MLQNIVHFATDNPSMTTPSLWLHPIRQLLHFVLLKLVAAVSLSFPFFLNLEVLDEFFFTSHHRVPESLRTTQLQFLSAQHLKQFNHSQQRSPAPNHLLLSSTSTSGHFLLDCGEKKFASSAATKPNQITAEMSQKLHTELQFKLSH